MSLDISAMMDGELDEHGAQRALTTLREDDEARQAWEHYHLIGDALRGTGASSGGRGLQQRVFAALASEPTVLAPSAKRAAPPARWLRYSVAAAATLAAFGLYTWFTPQAPDPQLVVERATQTRGLAANPGAGVSAAAASSADDPYLDAHFEVSPIRPVIMRAGWQPNDQR